MSKKIHKKEFKALGTDISIWLIVNDGQTEIAENHLHELEKLYLSKHALLSRFSDDSELTRFNRQLGIFATASDDLIHLSESSIKFWQETGGIFDPRVIDALEDIGYKKDFRTSSLEKVDQAAIPTISGALDEDIQFKGDQLMFKKRVDFSGIAKGYITDLAKKFLRAHGYDDFLVDSGGDMFLSGRNVDGEKWRVSLEGVDEKRMQIELENEAIATSGITRRKWENKAGKFHHLITPAKTEQFDFELKSVTFIGTTTEEADVWAKTMFLMGKKRGLEYANEHEKKCVFLDYRGMASISQKAKESLIIF